MALEQVEEQQAQALRGRLVERDERLVEQQEVGLDHERARQRGAARHAQRQARGVDVTRGAEPDLGQRRADPRGRVGAFGQHEAQIVLDGAPGQQARLLKDVGETGARRRAEPAREVRVEAGHDIEQGGLAATRRADDRQPLAGRHRQPHIVQHELGRRRAHGREPLLAHLEAQRRHWLTRRSSGCSTPHSISCTTTMNDSA